MSRLCVIGSWHLATVMSAGFAELGHKVTCVDSDVDSIASLARGRPIIFEPKLERLVRKNLTTGRLSFTTEFRVAVPQAAVTYIALDTPITATGVDLTPIWSAVESAASVAKGNLTLVVTSPVPVGTCEKIADAVRRVNPKVRCAVVCNPEFLRLGTAVEIFRRPDRIIIGAADSRASKRVAALFKALNRPILFMSLREAEMSKHAINAFMANTVSFVGELTRLCDTLGVNAFNVCNALKLDSRVGRHAYLQPGLGFNGGTVARDVRLLIQVAHEMGQETPLLSGVLESNDRQNGLILERLKGIFGQLNGLRIGLLGLTYKTKTSTLRASLALQIAMRMAQQGADLIAFDPAVPGNLITEPPMPICGSVEEAARDRDALVIMSGKTEFRNLNLGRLRHIMRRAVLVDAVNMFDPVRVVASGFTYVGIGRGFQCLDGREPARLSRQNRH